MVWDTPLPKKYKINFGLRVVGIIEWTHTPIINGVLEPMGKNHYLLSLLKNNTIDAF